MSDYYTEFENLDYTARVLWGYSHGSMMSLSSPPGEKLTLTLIEPDSPLCFLNKSLKGNMLSSARYTGR
jgi:hypothetical protein